MSHLVHNLPEWRFVSVMLSRYGGITTRGNALDPNGFKASGGICRIGMDCAA